jgi:NAD+ diphosphatase
VRSLQLGYLPPSSAPKSGALQVIVNDGQVLVDVSKQTLFFPFGFEGTPTPDRMVGIGWVDDQPCYVTAATGTPAPPGTRFVGLRDLFDQVDEESLGVAGRAVQVMEFLATRRFCGRCGAMNALADHELSMVCPVCGQIEYPRLSPAIIVLVRDNDRCLLARSPRFPEGMYSVIAGFVEPGETIEHAVHREVREEVGVSIRSVQYWGSQPWPFPHSLMIGFTAEYAGGPIVIDNREIEAAAWFGRDHLPQLPGPMSIAYALINDFLQDDQKPAPA